MPRVQTPEDLHCGNCNACIAPEGRITCMRCKQSVDIASAPMSGPWSCPKCPEHGERPKTLAKDGAIQCRFCDHKNPIPNMGAKAMSEEKTLTMTSIYRDGINLRLAEIKLRVQGHRDLLFDEDLNRRRVQLENTLAVLDMGFDIERFEEFMSLRPGLGETHATLPPSDGYFDFRLPIKRCQGIRDATLALTAPQKSFGVFLRGLGEKTEFDMRDIVLENISYSSDYPEDMPQVTLAGNVLGLQVRVKINKHSMLIRAGKNPDGILGRAGDSFYYSLELDARP